MPQRPTLIHFSPRGATSPSTVRDFAERSGCQLIELSSSDEVMSRVGRAYPAALIIDGSTPSDRALELCRQIKAEAFTSVVPVIIYNQSGSEESASAALEAGADEVLTRGQDRRESDLRLSLALRRAERDVSVHPTTRLPGTVQIERDFAERLASGQKFAVCYADIDHFKEFNDRYGYHRGDRVILITSRILRDIVRAHAPGGFVGHIGGDDFIFSVPLDHMRICCEEVLAVFDTLMPLQYSLEDQERGHFRGRDRRGNEYDVPLMSLSIGVVSNEHRVLSHTGEISELAAEMKNFAKTHRGSIFVLDRRGGDGSSSEEPETSP